jgi:hypothetical protein
MAEQSIDFISSIEAEQQSAFSRKLHGELDRSLTDGFETALVELIEYASRDIPESPVTNLVERTGPQGILPPPERRAAAIASLSGEKPVETRVFVDAEYTGLSERPIDLVELHFVTEFNAGSLAGTGESEDVATLLNWFDRVRSVRDWRFETEEGATVRVRKIAGVMHLIKRGVIGNISYRELPLNGEGEVDRAAAAFTDSFREVVSGAALGQISDDFVSHELLTRQIGGKIMQPHQRGVLRLPVFIAPKSYDTQIKSQYRPISSATPPFVADLPSVLVVPGQETRAGMIKAGLGFQSLKEVK